VKSVSVTQNYQIHSAINQAIQESKGEYILLLDPRTIPTEMMIENFKLKKLRQNAFYVAQHVTVDNFDEEILRKVEIPVGGFHVTFILCNSHNLRVVE
jgi:hypothetical protein